MSHVIVDRITSGLANRLIIFNSTETNRMSLDEGAEVGGHLKVLSRIERTPDGSVYDHDGTDDAIASPGVLSQTCILTQPTLASAKSTFDDIHQYLGDEMTLRSLASQTATAKMTKCIGTFLTYSASDQPHTMRVEFEWQLKTDFS